MQTRIAFADLPRDQQLCLVTAVRCNGLSRCAMGWVGRHHHAHEGSSVHLIQPVAGLARRGLLTLCDGVGAALPTDDGIAVFNGVAAERAVHA
jgi:hypothetical protein